MHLKTCEKKQANNVHGYDVNWRFLAILKGTYMPCF